MNFEEIYTETSRGKMTDFDCYEDPKLTFVI